MSDLVVELTDVTVTLGGRPVLEDVNLQVERGDYLALIGPNGGGKSTLIRVIVGLLTPDRGSVRVLDHSPDDAHGRVGYVPQYARFDLDFPIRVSDVVHMGRLGHGRGAAGFGFGRRDPQAVARVLERLEIAQLADRPIGALSGGQLQRVLIARALAAEPEILILDEPTASLDIQSADAFYALVNSLAERMTVIVATHDIAGLSTHVRRVACINRHLFCHATEEVSATVLSELYGHPVSLIAHGEHTHSHPAPERNKR